VPSEGRLADSGTLTGCQFFVKINTNLATVGEPPVADPPSQSVFSPNPVGDLAIANSCGVIALKLAVPTTPTRHTLVWGTAPGSAGATFSGRFVFLGLLPNPIAGISDIQKLYVGRYGIPPVGTRVLIHTGQQINGRQDTPKTDHRHSAQGLRLMTGSPTIANVRLTCRARFTYLLGFFGASETSG
jgi:hypothetical protein